MDGVLGALGISVQPDKMMSLYALLACWTAALVFVFIQVAFSQKAGDVSKQNSFNTYTWLAILLSLLTTFFLLRLGSAY